MRAQEQGLFDLGAGEGLRFAHAPPERADAPTFVFVNALTGDLGAWEAVVAPRLRAEGFGTLSYNFRGQEGSPFAADRALTPDLIAEDLTRLIQGLAPARPVLTGLSIGGLFAARAWLGGCPAAGLALLNTLREIGPRIAWVNDAMPRLVAHGGVGLFLDLLFPLLVNHEMAAAARPNFLKGGYQPLPEDHGHMNLMRQAGAADWALPYETLSLPTLVITGRQDRVFLDEAVVDRLFARLPQAERESWEDAGHLLPQERPERLAARLAAFGRTLESGGAG
ncbi:MAG: alpha/beta hydrolase [Pseudomonadota bacterium]